MKFKTINPATEEVLGEYSVMDTAAVMKAVRKAKAVQVGWAKVDISERAGYFKKLAAVLRKDQQLHAENMTKEMGKPIKEAKAEVEKCAWSAEVYADTGEAWLADEKVEADGKEHYVRYEPLGLVMSIMPWNFPYWQALRFGIPSLLAGNGTVLKHSNQVPECALAIQAAFEEAGFPEGLFTTVITGHEATADAIASDLISGVSLTGSTGAGMRIGAAAGAALKPCVLELGGSDPFIVLDDADIEKAATAGVGGRFLNCGQSCIASKRFLVQQDVFDDFARLFADKTKEKVIGNPMDEQTDIGPLVNKDAFDGILNQFTDAVSNGAEVLTGGRRVGDKGYFFAPAVLKNVSATMKVMSEEVFGPIAPVFSVKDEDEAIRIANGSEFGLGGSVFTKDLERGKQVASRIESGAVFVNNFTKSDPRMPFGGVKKSGIGRELSHFGLKEFVNVKGYSVYE